MLLAPGRLSLPIIVLMICLPLLRPLAVSVAGGHER